MFTVRRWWDNKGLQFGLLGLAVGGAWTLRQTQGAVVLETYQMIARPFQMLQTEPSKEENFRDARLLELQTQVAELQTQNKNLKNLLKYTEPEATSSRPAIARVVGRGADSWWQQVTLNRGTNAGIHTGDIVKADGGLVGSIQSVTSNTSRVLLVSDLNSRVGVTIARTGAKGFLRGDTSSQGVVEFYEKVPNVKPGDLVATSTYSQKFPSGIPVGQVKSLDLKRVPTSVGKVELFPSIRSLDWVTVYPKPQKQDMEQQPPKSN